MSIAQSLLAELEQESAGTRRVLAAVPHDHADFRPHKKSMTLGALAVHVATLPTLVAKILLHDSLDVNLRKGWTKPSFDSTEQLVADFDRSIEEARATLEQATDEQMGQSWSLRGGEQVFFTLPRVAVLRSMVFNHTVHHRAQLGVYLRLLDVPVPGLYGPTADEIPAPAGAA